MRYLLASVLILTAGIAHGVELSGAAVQGGLIFGHAEPGSRVSLDGQQVAISSDGLFVVGFGRDETGERALQVIAPGGDVFGKALRIKPSKYDIEIVEGLPPKTVTPDPEAAARIREDARMVATARQHRDNQAWYAHGFTWPVKGRISGVYGSQRVLNGEPRNPHFGLDIAAPEGATVLAPADGLITLTHPDMYYSGGTVILDHGQGLSSTFLHLSEILVEAGAFVKQGEPIARVGATGRASGPHLDWRMNWLDRRVNPQPLLPVAGDSN
jgi:murein DD-endopeptidase MepM/ murein hydrolase activator NlpD